MVTPFLSVLVIVHKRREFVRAAVHSAMNQTLPRERYEVIVVMDFHDLLLETELRELGARPVVIEGQGQGAKVEAGLGHARGNVICPLDDDDLLSQDRLAIVLQEFEGDPELVFFHNDYQLIDQLGHELPRSTYRALGHRQMRVDTRIHFTDAEKRTSLSRLAFTDSDFNSSCMAVLKSALLARGEFLARQELSMDMFYFVSALIARGSILVDGRRLTRYRIHGSNLSLPAKLPFDEFCHRGLSLQVRHDAALRNISLACGANAPVSLTQALRGLRLIGDIYAFFFGKPARRSTVLREWVLLLTLFDTFAVPRERKAILLCLPFVFSPSLFRRIYYRWHSLSKWGDHT